MIRSGITIIVVFISISILEFYTGWPNWLCALFVAALIAYGAAYALSKK